MDEMLREKTIDFFESLLMAGNKMAFGENSLKLLEAVNVQVQNDTRHLFFGQTHDVLRKDYIQNIEAESNGEPLNAAVSVTFDILDKCANAPTVLHLEGVVALLIPILLSYAQQVTAAQWKEIADSFAVDCNTEDNI